MSVYKEDAYLLEKIADEQVDLKFWYYRPESLKTSGFAGGCLPTQAHGFNLDYISPNQKKAVDELREWVRENKEYGTIENGQDFWRFTFCMDEGPYGWNVIVEKRQNYLGLNIRPFTRYEA